MIKKYLATVAILSLIAVLYSDLNQEVVQGEKIDYSQKNEIITLDERRIEPWQEEILRTYFALEAKEKDSKEERAKYLAWVKNKFGLIAPQD